MYLHPLLLAGQQQDLYRIPYGLTDLPLLELVDQLVAHEEVELEVVLVLLGQLHVLEHRCQITRLLAHLGYQLLYGPHQHVCILATHPQTHQQLVDVHCERGVAYGEFLEQLPTLLHLQEREEILHVRLDGLKN